MSEGGLPRGIEHIGGRAPFNPAQELTDFIPESFAKIEAMDYAGAFGTLAERLEAIGRHSPEKLYDEEVQKHARATLKQIWAAFISDITDHKKKSARLDSMSEETDRRRAAFRDRPKDAEAHPISEERMKYLRALRDQQAGGVVSFPSPESQKKDFNRSFDLMVEKTVEEPIDAIFEDELRHIDYIGTLFNDVMPLMRKLTEGYVTPMIKGNRKYSDYLPVTAETLRGNLIGFLEDAPGIAGTLSNRSQERERANQVRPPR